MIYGYAIVSTKGQAKDGSSLENQIELLKENGAVEIYSDSFTVTKVHRSEFSKLLLELKCEDTLIITKLDKFARSINQDSELVNDLLSRGIKVNMLNIGGMDNTPTSKIIRNIFFSFAEFERDMIIERT
nr:recombinase family protein [uncultured Clostridium sp.]